MMSVEFKTNDRTSEFFEMDIEKNKVVSLISYLGVLFFLPLVACPDSEFGRFHANQALIIFFAELALGVLTGALGTIGVIPLFGILSGILAVLVGSVGGLVCTVYTVMGIVYTAQGKAVELPLIGGIKIIK